MRWHYEIPHCVNPPKARYASLPPAAAAQASLTQPLDYYRCEEGKEEEGRKGEEGGLNKMEWIPPRPQWREKRRKRRDDTKDALRALTAFLPPLWSPRVFFSQVNLGLNLSPVLTG